MRATRKTQETREEVAFRIRDVDRLYNAERERVLTEYGKRRIPAAPLPRELDSARGDPR